ncbi:hypothetical protein KFK09_025896 [Dendrobium nobile]|uniref:Secreted protein n=1 Tax=Dendrobium nobile TaxID=94219 RepID=A0A8T3A542_DENNO|nr:hypothetical protein KFK09_025896 [Dendrobium nobile]
MVEILNFLSFAIILQLIKSSVGAGLSHWFHSTCIPKDALRKIKPRPSFFSLINGLTNKLYILHWIWVSKPMNLGGLRI